MAFEPGPFDILRARWAQGAQPDAKPHEDARDLVRVRRAGSLLGLVGESEGTEARSGENGGVLGGDPIS